MNNLMIGRAWNQAGRGQAWETNGSNHAQLTSPMTEAELRAVAPSIFAGEAHGSRSSRYTYLPTINVMEGLAAAGFLPFDARQSKSRDVTQRDFTKHMVRFRLLKDAGGWRNDVAIPEVVLVNSHDGTSSFQMFGGLFRALCFNGLIISDGRVETIRIAHKGNVVPEVVEGAYRVLEQCQTAALVQPEWAAITCTEQERRLLANEAHVLRFGEPEFLDGGKVVPATPIQPEQLLKVRRSEDAGKDLWTTFNVIQENCIAGGLAARHDRKPGEWRGRKVRTREVKGIDQDVKLNKALWAITEHFARIKQAA